MSRIGGWFKCYRQLEDSAIWGNPELVYFWVWCLMQADIEKSQAEITAKDFDATAGGGAVSVKVSGAKVIKEIFRNEYMNE